MAVAVELGSILAPVFVLIGLGFGWGRSPWPFDQEFVGRFTIYLAAPCLTLGALSKLSIPPTALIEIGWAWLVAQAGFVALGVVAVVVARWRMAPTLPCLVFPNVGNVGLPLSLFAFGEEGLALAVAVFAIALTLNQILSAWLFSGGRSFLPALRLPVVYAALIAVALIATGTRLPDWLQRTVDLIGAVTIPFMLIALGVALARLRVDQIGRSLAIGVLRVGGGFAIGAAAAWGLGLTGAARGVLVIQAAMPTAVFAYVFALHYKESPEVVAGAVVASTVVGLVALPAIVLYVL